jgi:DNA-binding SARP family transcriptional activator/tetratricopeptide (TPR) repeat protein
MVSKRCTKGAVAQQASKSGDSANTRFSLTDASDDHRWRIQVLGPLAITRLGGPSVSPVTQRRRLALLAVLAVAGERGISRDALIALIWPESDTESGRHSLRQLLYGLRRDLGAAVVLGSAELKLDPAQTSSDVLEFDSLVSLGELGAAVSLYRGEFLEGFHLSGATEFERWVDSVRDRVARDFTAAVETLATTAQGRGEHRDALAYWRRLTTREPLSSRLALRYAQALANAHDEAGALQSIDAYARLAEAELGITLPPALVALRSSLQATTVRIVAPPVSREAKTRTSAVTIDVEPLVRTESTAAPSQKTSAAVPARRHGLRRSFAAIAAAFVLVGVTWAGLTPRGISDASGLMANRVAVLPFSIDASAQAGTATELATLLGTTVDGIGGLTIVGAKSFGSSSGAVPVTDPAVGRALARGMGAPLFVLGRMSRVGSVIRLSVQLYETMQDSAPLARAMVEGPVDSARTLSARASAALFAGRIAGINAQIEETAAYGSSSPAALRHFLEGESAFSRARYADAADAFGLAVAADSSFALAWYRLSVADDWANRGTEAVVAANRAYRLREHLTPHDSLRLEGLEAWRHGEYDRAEVLYRQIATAYPWDLEAWYQLGEVLFHGNPSRGRTVLEAQPAFERALSARPTNREALVHLQLLAALRRDHKAIDSLTSRIRGAVPDSESIAQLAIAAYSLRDTALATRVLGALRGQDEATIYNVAWRVGVFTDNLEGALDVAHLMTLPQRTASERALGHGVASYIHLAQGRPKAADADLAAAASFLPNWALHQRAFRSIFPASPATEEVRRAILDSLEHHVPGVEERPGTAVAIYSWPAQRQQDNVFLRALLALSLHDASALLRARQWAVSHPSARLPNSTLLNEIDAMRSALAGKYEQALATVPASANSTSGFGGHASLLRLKGEWASAAGRTEEAIQRFGSFEELDLPNLAYAAFAHRRRGALLEGKGDRVSALREYQRVLELWRNCDATVAPTRDSVLARVRALTMQDQH